MNMSTLRDRSSYFNLGRLCEERDDRSKSPKLHYNYNYNYNNNNDNYQNQYHNQNQNNITHLSQNKGVIKNIESNVIKIIIKIYNKNIQYKYTIKIIKVF
jgi:hypothetical protein